MSVDPSINIIDPNFLSTQTKKDVPVTDEFNVPPVVVPDLLITGIPLPVQKVTPPDIQGTSSAYYTSTPPSILNPAINEIGVQHSKTPLQYVGTPPVGNLSDKIETTNLPLPNSYEIARNNIALNLIPVTPNDILFTSNIPTTPVPPVVIQNAQQTLIDTKPPVIGGSAVTPDSFVTKSLQLAPATTSTTSFQSSTYLEAKRPVNNSTPLHGNVVPSTASATETVPPGITSASIPPNKLNDITPVTNGEIPTASIPTSQISLTGTNVPPTDATQNKDISFTEKKTSSAKPNNQLQLTDNNTPQVSDKKINTSNTSEAYKGLVPTFFQNVLTSPAGTLPKGAQWVLVWSGNSDDTSGKSNSYYINGIPSVIKQVNKYEPNSNNWQIDKAFDTVASDNYNKVCCMFAQSILLPNESMTLQGEGVQRNGLIRSYIGLGRNDPQQVTVSFLETNVDFVDNVIRPWVIMTSHLGLIARPPEQTYRTNMVLYKLGITTKDNPPTILETITFYGACPVSVDGHEFTYAPYTQAIRKNATFTYYYYTIDSSKNAFLASSK
jgi:hypothetical protein